MIRKILADCLYLFGAFMAASLLLGAFCVGVVKLLSAIF